MKNLTIVRSLDAPRNIGLDELTTCTWHLDAKIKAMGKRMPPILVLHVSESAAAAFGVQSTGIIRHNRNAAEEPQSYYEIWLVGQASIASYAMALEGILKDYFTLRESA